MKLQRQETGVPSSGGSGGCEAREERRRRWSMLVMVFALVVTAVTAVGCDSGDGSGDGQTTLPATSGSEQDDIQGVVGEDLEVGDAVVTVRALEVAFQPAMPPQRLSDETPAPPAAGEGFYQAYVRVTNNGMIPIRVDPSRLCLRRGERCRQDRADSVRAPAAQPHRRHIAGSTADLQGSDRLRADAHLQPVLVRRGHNCESRGSNDHYQHHRILSSFLRGAAS